ncbi:MAG: HAD hydrolase family protein [Gemmatimonas sp.]|nr:HAD hydrolase family protein [Gemmatimonas sp.]
MTEKQSTRDAPLILATDLDGTFAGGTSLARRDLQEAIRCSPAATLIYVTGRSVPATREIIAEAPLPQPDLLIADVGTTVVRGDDFQPLREVQGTIEDLWPGADTVRHLFRDFPGIEEQEVRAPNRVSYWLREGAMEETLTHMTERLDDERLDLIGSAGVYIDVLPPGVNKGSTLLRVLDWLDVPGADVVVAGDTLNDLALFETGLRGVVVSNCEAGLRDRLANRKHVYFARGEGAAGVHEGLQFFGCLQGGADGE